MRVDITLQEDTSTCATGQTSDPVPIYINVPEYSIPLELSATMFHSSLTETAAKGTVIGQLHVEKNKSATTFVIKSVVPNPLYANDGGQYTDSPTSLTEASQFVTINNTNGYGQLLLNCDGVDFENNGQQQKWNGNTPIKIKVQAYDPETKNIQVETFSFNLTDVNESPYWAQNERCR